MREPVRLFECDAGHRHPTRAAAVQCMQKGAGRAGGVRVNEPLAKSRLATARVPLSVLQFRQRQEHALWMQALKASETGEAPRGGTPIGGPAGAAAGGYYSPLRVDENNHLVLPNGQRVQAGQHPAERQRIVEVDPATQTPFRRALEEAYSRRIVPDWARQR